MANMLTIVTLAIGAAACLALLGLAYPRVVGTTLLSPWWWCVGTIITCACVGVGMALWPELPSGRAWGLIASTSTFCPLMAVLGARRPHHLAWNFIVGSLWLVAALPALEQLFLQRESLLDVGPVRGWFLWLIIGLGLANYLPTRFGPAAILAVAGQIVLLRAYLPGVNSLSHSSLVGFENAIGVGLFAAALLAAQRLYRHRRLPSDEFDAQWLAVRDALGALWALRILQRINAAGSTFGWPFSLTWTGFYFHVEGQDWDDVSPETQKDLGQTMDSLLRRFVRTPK